MPADSRGTRRPGEFTSMQQLFIERYMVHRSARRAAAEAGYSDVQAAGWRLLQNETICDEIRKRKEAQRRRNELLEDEVLQEMAKLAFVDISDVVDFSGSELTVKDLEEIPEHVRPTIKKVTKTSGKYGDNITVELHDKVGALLNLGRYLSMWVDKTESKNVISFEDALRELDSQGEDYNDL
jgi:phage terminase small subunit